MKVSDLMVVEGLKDYSNDGLCLLYKKIKNEIGELCNLKEVIENEASTRKLELVKPYVQR